VIEGNPDPAHAHAPLHAADEWVLKEGRKPRPYGCALCRLVQLVCILKTLRVTPAMAAGLTDKLLSMEDVAATLNPQNRIGPRSTRNACRKFQTEKLPIFAVLC
jgi:hypothetical protein